MTTHRKQRVADLVREELAGIIGSELRDPRVGFVTVTEVRLSPDLKSARVFVASQASDEDDGSDCIAALNHAAAFLRRHLARRVKLRYVPSLRFFRDAALEQGNRVEEILRSIRDPEADDPES